MRVTCPNCCEAFPIDAGFADDDGKRLAALFAEMEPVLGRAVIGYMRLFRPAKTSLRTARAIKIVQELLDLVRAGTVCRDERSGVRRPASPATWAAGIEQMLAAPGKLDLPLSNHNYLRAIVYALADQVGAQAERAKEADLRAGRRRAGPSDSTVTETPLEAQLRYLAGLLHMGTLTQAEHDERAAAARVNLGGAP
jgi:hypothetical protein